MLACGALVSPGTTEALITIDLPALSERLTGRGEDFLLHKNDTSRRSPEHVECVELCRYDFGVESDQGQTSQLLKSIRQNLQSPPRRRPFLSPTKSAASAVSAGLHLNPLPTYRDSHPHSSINIEHHTPQARWRSSCVRRSSGLPSRLRAGVCDWT